LLWIDVLLIDALMYITIVVEGIESAIIVDSTDDTRLESIRRRVEQPQ